VTGFDRIGGEHKFTVSKRGTLSMVEDLSLRHGLVSSMFELPKTPAEWGRHRLPQGQVDFFKENGYLAGVRLLSDDQVETLREELKGLFDPSHPGHELFYEYHSNEAADATTVLFHALGAWRIAPGMHDVLWNPAFTVAAGQLLDGAVRFWHDQLFCKPARGPTVPGGGGVVAWHQDYSYWTRTKPIAHLSCWIALDDSSRENGCLHYIPGSHRWPLLPITGLAGDMHAIQGVLNDEQKAQFNEVPVEFPKGYAAFHHPLTVHGSYANRSDRPRRALVINVFRDGVVSDSDDPLLEGVPPIPKGQKMDGQFFPLLSVV
jgi:ectoine hydroxylase-related dioxygenase (phytanoyl-CoA dioxygenase family)